MFNISDTENDKVGSFRFEMVVYKEGTYRGYRNKDGEIKFKQMKPEALVAAAAAEDSEPCPCKVCVAREKNSIMARPVGFSGTRTTRR